jgi:cytoskeletal protein CcmA (bactofilin family)
MMRMAVRASILLSPLAVLLALCDGASAQDTGRRVTIEGTRAANVYVAGGTVDVRGELQKDLVAAGGTVTVERLVRGDVIVAGGTVHLGGEVGDDVRAVGGLVTVASEVGGELVAAGGDVVLERTARVAGATRLAGGTVAVHGDLGGYLRVAGGEVTIGGQVDGDVGAVGRSITVLPGARVTGNFTYASPGAARIDPAAQILGRVSREPVEWAERARWAGRGVVRAIQVVVVLGLLATGVVFLLLFPGVTLAVSRAIATAPWSSLGIGALLLVGGPVLAVLLMVTIVGIPLGLLTIALYLVSLVLGFLAGAIFLGDLLPRVARRETPSTGLRVLGLVLALVALGLAGLIPVAGGLIHLAALLLGLGALGLYARRRYAA